PARRSPRAGRRIRLRQVRADARRGRAASPHRRRAAVPGPGRRRAARRRPAGLDAGRADAPPGPPGLAPPAPAPAAGPGAGAPRLDRSLSEVGLDRAYRERYPHQLSGGQRQRIGVARAVMVAAKYLVCGEPVAALDVSIQAQVISLFMDLREQDGFTYLFISH